MVKNKKSSVGKKGKGEKVKGAGGDGDILKVKRIPSVSYPSRVIITRLTEVYRDE